MEWGGCECKFSVCRTDELEWNVVDVSVSLVFVRVYELEWNVVDVNVSLMFVRMDELKWNVVDVTISLVSSESGWTWME
jgi:hypothetical protein